MPEEVPVVSLRETRASVSENTGQVAIELPAEPAPDPFLVQFDGVDDPTNPLFWSRPKRWYMTLASGVLVLNATFASSAPSGVIKQLTERFEMSEKVATLTLSLFVTGYCVGPILWGPLSERYGRRPIFLSAFFLYVCTQLGSALAKNTASVLVFRFLGGTFAACPLSNSGALISDIWDAETRGKALAIFAVTPFAGPALGPAVAGFLGEKTDWRWVFWLLTIFSGVCWIMILVTIPETYAPIILVYKARKLRKSTGDSRYYAALEKNRPRPHQLFDKVLARPFKVLFHEPMLIAITAYLSFAYGCLYLMFEAYPFVFTRPHNLSPGLSGLTFLPVAVGGAMAVAVYVAIFNPRYEREAKKYAPNPVPPEFRLEMALIAGPMFAVSFFWFGWTSFPSISLWVPLMSGIPVGFSMSWIFLSLFNYIIDAYLAIAASAIAASIIWRSLAGAAFPLFAGNMYDALGPRWASSLLGFVAVAMIPIPFVLIKYGPKLRKNSKYAASAVLPVAKTADKV
ncbi:MFS general substrate transporter [Collybia nuda]|uniref:MFS general substrate transporter n=1 Tax=Collybia nuda TaxID=64659 RepID=A0A9P5Y8T8_9AGAR|nr:MFS general substrate transporter [Collybia nuda]